MYCRRCFNKADILYLELCSNCYKKMREEFEIRYLSPLKYEGEIDE